MIHRTPTRLVIYVISAAAFLFPPALRAQFPPTKQDFTGDTLGYAVNDTFHMVDGDYIGAAYQFEQNYDSSRVDYIVTDVRLNGGVWNLTNYYCDSSLTEVDDDGLATLCGTEPVVIHSGDTIRFFREFLWFNPFTSVRVPFNYIADDTLDYSVALIDNTSGDRLALIDSMGVTSPATRGYPLLYGSRPIEAVITYVVPPSYDGDTAALRFHPYARGSGAYYFVRTCTRTVQYTAAINTPREQEYIATFGGGVGKRSPNAIVNTVRDATILSITPNPVHGGRFEIRYTLPARVTDGGALTIAIYNTRGDVVFIPAMISNAARHAAVPAFLRQPGTYFAILNYNGQTMVAETFEVRN